MDKIPRRGFFSVIAGLLGATALIPQVETHASPSAPPAPLPQYEPGNQHLLHLWQQRRFLAGTVLHGEHQIFNTQVPRGYQCAVMRFSVHWNESCRLSDLRYLIEHARLQAHFAGTPLTSYGVSLCTLGLDAVPVWPACVARAGEDLVFSLLLQDAYTLTDAFTFGVLVDGIVERVA